MEGAGVVIAWFLNLLPFAIIGGALGLGSFSILDWQWWAWDLSIVGSIILRDLYGLNGVLRRS